MNDFKYYEILQHITFAVMVGVGPQHPAKFPIRMLHSIDAAAIW